jgi:hypothetical protein
MSLIQNAGSIYAQGDVFMTTKQWDEPLEEQKVTYSLELEGRFILIENVPARVNVETGERYFSPDTVERLQRTIWEHHTPSRVVETPVFEFTG